MITKEILILAPPLSTLQDITGPWEVFSRVEAYRPGSYRIKVVATGTELEVDTKFNLPVRCHCSIHECTTETDTILVVGSEQGVSGNVSESFISWLKCMMPSTRRMGSVCTGAFYLAHAGLLDGYRATTHWRYLDRLRTEFPLVIVEDDPVYVLDGKICTSAGITAGIDLALALVTDDCGYEVAHNIARELVVFMQRQSNQSQLSRSLVQKLADRDPIRMLQQWAPANLSHLAGVEDMAAQVNMSPRNFARRFKEETGETPGNYLRQLRTEAVRGYTGQNGLSREAQAQEAGFGSVRSMLRALQEDAGK